jgi:hypothetical protein
MIEFDVDWQPPLNLQAPGPGRQSGKTAEKLSSERFAMSAKVGGQIYALVG